VKSQCADAARKVVGIMVVASLLLWLLSSVTASAQSRAPTSNEPSEAPAAPPGTTKPPEAQSREAWAKAMAQTPQPKNGCFKSSYPTMEWQEVPCTTAPSYPQPPRQGFPSPTLVGNGNDVSAQVPTGVISKAIGSFDSVTGVTSESGPRGNTGPSVANAYTLQLNTNFFASTVCASSPNPACVGWQQFIFENDGSAGRAYIQYWLIGFNTTCPAEFKQFSFAGSAVIDCVKNNHLGAVAVPVQPITNLGHLMLIGTVSPGGDSVSFTARDDVFFSVTGDNAVNAAAGWQIAEFNVFGDGGNSTGGGQASFNSGSVVVPRVEVIFGDRAPDRAPPTCVAVGFTGETNNLSLGVPAPAASQPGPALLFTESSTGNVPSSCAAATTVGGIDPCPPLLGFINRDFDKLRQEPGPDLNERKTLILEIGELTRRAQRLGCTLSFPDL
jgi:hypothetical protein